MARRLERGQGKKDVWESEPLSQGLLLLEQIGEIANLPGLKGFAGVASLILEICQSAKSNKDEWRSLGDDVGALAMAVADRVEEHKPYLDTELANHISHLCQRLESVHSELEKLSPRRSVIWFTKYAEDATTLQKLQKDIKGALDIFAIQSSIRIGRGVRTAEVRSAERHGQILDMIEDVCEAAMARITSDKEPVEVHPEMASPIFKLPLLPCQFFGREAEIDYIATTLTDYTASHIAILGSAGIGKTALATKILHDCRVAEIFGIRRYFVSCDAAGEKGDLLTVIAGSLGVHGTKLQKQVLEKLGGVGERALLVLDNFETPWESTSSRPEVETLLSTIAGLDNLAIILTMRGAERPQSVAWSRPFLRPLKPLDAIAARRIFIAVSDCPNDDPFIDELLNAVDCVPLALILMATLAQTDRTDILLHRWREERSSLLHQTPDRRTSLDVSIRISLNSPRMKALPEALQLLSLLSLLPDGIETRNLEGIVPAMRNSRRALSTLWQTSLAYDDGNNRTRVLSTIRGHMLLYHQLEAALQAPMMAYYMGIIGLSRNLGGPHGQTIVKRITPEIGNLHSVVNYALELQPGLGENVLRGATMAAIDLSRFTRYTHLGNLNTPRLAVATAERLGDPLLLADASFHLGRLEFTLKPNNNSAEELCNRAMGIYEEVQSIQGQAECTWLLGQMRKNTKRQQECRAIFEKGLALSTQSGNKDCQARCLAALSEIAFWKGDIDKSESQCRESLQLFRELENVTNIGMNLSLLGQIAELRSQHSLALEYWEEAIQALQKAGAYQQVGRVLIFKGDVFFARCEFPAAREEYNRALAVFRERGFLQWPYAAYVQLSLGTVAAALYDVTAIHWVDMAFHAFEKTGASHGLLHCRIVYGDLAFHSGPPRFQEAEALYIRALDSCRASGFTAEEALCNTKLGVLSLARCRMGLAMHHHIVASSIHRKMSTLGGQANAMIRLGEVYLAEGDSKTALALYRAAYPVCCRLEALRDVADSLKGIGKAIQSRSHLQEAMLLYEKTGDLKGKDVCMQLLASY